MADPFAVLAEPLVVAADGSVVVVAKPPRMHSAPGRSTDDLCSWVFARFPDAAGAGKGVESERPAARNPAEGGLLHRLDYETSGLVLFARSPEAFDFLIAEQEAGRFRKEYILRSRPGERLQPTGSRPTRSAPESVDPEAWAAAIASSDAAAASGLLFPPARLASDSSPYVECSFRAYGPGAARVACVGKEAARGKEGRLYRTEIASLQVGAGPWELAVAIAQGFRHQIRAQMAWIGLPIVGDPLYGGDAAPRLYLHAPRLRFRHPVSGAETMIELA